MTKMKDFLEDVEWYIEQFLRKHENCPRCGIALMEAKDRKLRHLLEQERGKAFVVHLLCNGCNVDLTHECGETETSFTEAASIYSKIIDATNEKLPNGTSGLIVSRIIHNHNKNKLAET